MANETKRLDRMGWLFTEEQRLVAQSRRLARAVVGDIFRRHAQDVVRGFGREIRQQGGADSQKIAFHKGQKKDRGNEDADKCKIVGNAQRMYLMLEFMTR